ncbi:hypothetical protein [Lentimicrobium sp. S6]|uniref:hypothetical protein n=1 Tax=Lentimicrobium sp. S6 TaxID=2735872 RepID=UPI001557738A|nr:hypothetical protein [Lentimicrobium sp. S6]NPD44659.1 hypothetical protein [Lentimicrobium sp. S6]
MKNRKNSTPVFNVNPPKLKDTLHANGSKTYQTCYYGFITIKNPAFVKLLDQQINLDGFGFYYVGAIQNFVDTGQDIYNEYRNVLRILD